MEIHKLFDNSGIAIFSKSDESRNTIILENEPNYCYIRLLVFSSKNEKLKDKFINRYKINDVVKTLQIELEDNKELFTIGNESIVEISTKPIPIQEAFTIVNILNSMFILSEIIILEDI